MFEITITGETILKLEQNIADLLNCLEIGKDVRSDQPSQGTEKLVQNDPTDPQPMPHFDMTVQSETVGPLIAETFTEPHHDAGVHAPSAPHEKITPPVAPMQTVPSPALSNGTDCDSSGLPYDARIHNAAGTKKKCGTWKNKRGTEPALIAQVEAELRARVALPPVEVPPAPIATRPINVPEPLFPPVTAPAPTLTPVPQPIAAPVVPPVTIPQPTVPMSNCHSVQTFTDNLPEVITKLMAENKLTPDYIRSLKDYFQVDEIWNLNPQQSADMFENFVTQGFIVRAM